MDAPKVSAVAAPDRAPGKALTTFSSLIGKPAAAPAIANASGTVSVASFNAVLAVLRTWGMIET